MNIRLLQLIVGLLLPLLAAISCSSAKKNADHAAGDSPVATDEAPAEAVQFNADSAYSFVRAQCDFGPRVPNTDAHRRCGDFLVERLKRSGANVIEQRASLTAFDGTRLNARNIIAEFNPDSTDRILLLAHWDCRPWADNDADPANHRKPVMGANDGASGVGVLLELARLFAVQNPCRGIDILLVDAEDWGNHDADDEGSWALGTQYWISNPHRKGYRPQFGILLDMVGASGANFAKEYYSKAYAPSIVSDVWTMALKSGYGAYFSPDDGGGVTDDHVFINRAGIPCIDIIDHRTDSPTGFFDRWHTSGDTMECIDPSTLKAVGQTLTNLIYNRK